MTLRDVKVDQTVSVVKLHGEVFLDGGLVFVRERSP